MGFYTAFPVFLPLKICVLELLFRNSVQSPCHSGLNSFDGFKPSTFEVPLMPGEQEKCTRGHIRAIGRLWKHNDFYFGQKVLHNFRRVTECVIVVQFPVFGDVRTNAGNAFAKSFEDFDVKIGVNCCSWWNKLLVNDSFSVVKNNDHRFNF